MILDALVSVVLLFGAAFAAIAGVGLVRLGDLYMRTHAATKAGTLGAGLIVLAVAIEAGTWTIWLKALAAIAFLLLTAPVAAHLLGRAARLTGCPLVATSVVDQWGMATGAQASSTVDTEKDVT